MRAATSETGRRLMGCTAAYVCEAAHAAVLAQSFFKAHPESAFTILVIDGPNDKIAIDNARLLSLEDLKFRGMESARLPMLCNSEELRAVVIPVLLLTLLQEQAEIVAYFGAKTRLFHSISDLVASGFGEHTLISTPKIRNDFGDTGRSFVAAHRGGEELLRSWEQQLTQAVAGRDTGDDSDLSPDLAEKFDSIPHRQIAIEGFSLNYSNLDPASFTGANGDYSAAGHPMLAFDFRGYDPAKPHLLSRHQGTEPRILLSEHPVIASLCDEYREEVLAAGHERYAAMTYRFESVPDGPLIDPRMLRLYRAAILESAAAGRTAPPSPFGPADSPKFLDWLNEPLTKTAKAVTRYMLAVYHDREDVRKAFPEPLGENAAAFHDWYVRFGQAEMNLPDALVPKKADPNSIQAGDAVTQVPVNVAGYFRAELGIGVAARAVLSALETAGIPFNTLTFDATSSRQDHPFADWADQIAGADINIVCINPDTLPIFAERTGPEWRQGRYTIGLWFWEVEDFPSSLHGAFNYVDEVWVASDFMRETFRKVSPKPVFKYRLPILVPQVDPMLTRADFDLPDVFTFLFSFDMLSVLERKNPIGLINAFKQAFPDRGPALLIKTINGDKRCLEMEKLRYAGRGRNDIIFRDGYLSQIDNSALTALADCYVSLHRSEGFGLTIAEAMALGKPTIATAYSGNLEFMTRDNSYLCPARRCEVGPEREPYPADSHWSEPDINAAAGLLRQVFKHPEEARARGLRAAQHIFTAHSNAAAASTIRERLDVIRTRRKRPGLTPSTDLLEDRIAELEAERAAWAKT